MMRRFGTGLLLLIAGLCCGMLVAVAPDIAGAVLILQLPGGLILLFDPTPGRAIGRTVLLFAAAATVGPIADIWFQCDGLRQCVAMAATTHTILVMLLYAASGFMLTQLLPLLFRLLDERRQKVRLAELVAARAKIAEEWQLYS